MLRRIVFAALVLVAALAPAVAMERIERFVSDVDVQTNGDLLVTETIQVRAELNQIKRGILRDFPTTYHRPDGSRIEVGFAIASVTRDGSEESFSTEKMSNGVRVRIGSAARELSVGSHTYVIRYRTTRQIGFFADYDELYWNATGNGWTFIIDSAEARITLPQRVEFKQTALYTGRQGDKGQDARIVEERPGVIVFRTTKVLPVGHGLTVAAAFPKGVVIPPTFAQKVTSFVQDDPALLYAVLGGGAVALFYLVAWFLVGRDPSHGTIIPLFGPPEGMSAAAARYVSKMEFDNKTFSAAIVGLGVNGHLKLTDIDGDQVLHRVKSGKPIDTAEQAVEKALFIDTGRNTIPIEQTQHDAIFKAKFGLLRALKQTYAGKLFNTNYAWSVIGLIGAILVTVAICVAYSNSYPSVGGAVIAGILIPLLPLAGSAGAIRNARHGGGATGATVVIASLVILVALIVGFGLIAGNIGAGPAMLPAIVPWLLAPLVTLGVGWLEAPTREGRKVMDQIDGFKQYLSVAEEYRLNVLNPPEKTPELFERFLPYAIALDVQNQWAQRFTGVLAAAALAPAVSSWYQGDRSFDSNNDVVSFANNLGESFTNSIVAASVAPGSSGGSGGGDSFSSGGGSSGGGSSGGGGGGGGGSGW